MMRKIGAAALVFGLLGIGGCGGSGDVATANKLRDRMCACQDQKCMDEVEKDGDAFSQSLRKKYKSKDDIGEDTMKALDESHHAYSKCRRALRDKLEAAGSGSAATP